MLPCIIQTHPNSVPWDTPKDKRQHWGCPHACWLAVGTGCFVSWMLSSRAFCAFPQQQAQVWVSFSFPHDDFPEVCRSVIIFETLIRLSSLVEISLTVTGRAKQTGRYQQKQFTHPYKTTPKQRICHWLNTRKELSPAKQREETTATTDVLHTLHWTAQSIHFPEMIQGLGSQPAQSTAAEMEEDHVVIVKTLKTQCPSAGSLGQTWKTWLFFSWIGQMVEVKCLILGITILNCWCVEAPHCCNCGHWWD